MRIVIVGPGAIGSLIAAYLSKSKHEIWLLDKDRERAKKISEVGISITGVSGKWQAKPRITANPEEINNADIIILCVKSYSTKQALTETKALCTKDTLILSLQNGIGNVEIAGELIAPERIIAGVTNHGATLIEPGIIRHAGIGETVIGRIDGKIPVFLRSIRELFNSVGIQTKISRDIQSLLWSKLVINVGINALTAITHLHNGRLIEFEGTRNILQEAVKEAVRVAKRKKVRLIYDDPIAKVESVCEATSGNISSMLQDVLRKKTTEIDYINAVIVRQGQNFNIPTPANALLTNVVKTIEASYKLQIPDEKQ